MSGLAIPATAAALDDRADVGGGFCPLCKASADHSIGHARITQPGPIDTVLIDLPSGALEGLLARLAELPGPQRVVADVLDDWNHRHSGLASSSHGVGLFLDLLTEAGYRITPITTSNGPLPAPPTE
ncbi:hypothetical protein AB0H37_24805 [Actinomadura sp. NPDC023710]|uniref:hypothetical protein n=1 Tax=Actinomadura sp. NPDC023710 TaxID=3158219 RepID=UPI0033F74A91